LGDKIGSIGDETTIIDDAGAQKTDPAAAGSV
jgi:hypothetical protein